MIEQLLPLPGMLVMLADSLRKYKQTKNNQTKGIHKFTVSAKNFVVRNPTGSRLDALALKESGLGPGENSMMTL